MGNRTQMRGTIGVGAVASLVNVAAALAVAVRIDWQALLFLLTFEAMFTSAAVAVVVRPDSPAVRRFLQLGVLAVIWCAAQYLLLLAHVAWGAGAWFIVANTAQQVLDLALPTSLAAFLAVYPLGEYRHRLHRVLVRVLAGLVVIVPPLLLVSKETIQPAAILTWVGGAVDVDTVQSPFHVSALGWLAVPVAGYAQGVFVIAPALGALIVALRYPAAGREERVQIKWPLLAAIVVAVTSAEPVVDALFPELVGNVVQIVPLVALPVSLAVGLVAPHLFDIELVLSRTLAYGALWLLIGLGYVGLAAALGIAVRGQGLDVAVLVAIVATLLFDPARQWLVRRAAQWLGDAGVGSEELVRRLGQTLANTLDHDALVRGIAQTVRGGLGVEWVRIRMDGRIVADGPVPGDAVPSASAALGSAERGAGVLECGPRRRGRWREQDRDLLATLSGQAALALENARRAGDLAESRSRLVAAEESARRRIERDLHDGVQQQLVALIATIALARQDASGRHGTLDDLQAGAEQMLRDLRELVSGIHPSVLEDRGLVGAIESRVARLPIGVTVAGVDGLRGRRFTEVVEGTAYFFACEALTNALKHADADHVAVRLGLQEDVLTVEVTDDGRGFDVAAARGSGLGGLDDRLSAVGGQVVIESSPHAGTRITARLPADVRVGS